MAAVTVAKDAAARIVSPEAHAQRGELCSDLRWLRANNPCGMVEAEGFDPFWLVARHEDVLAMSRANDLFVNSARPAVIVPRKAEAAMRARNGRPFILPFLTNMDAPEHLRYRRIVAGWFTPARMRRLEAQIRIVAKTSVDHLASCGPECDFVRELSLRYPLKVLMQVIGIPVEDEDFLLQVTQQIFGNADVDLSRDATAYKDGDRLVEMAVATMDDAQSYFRTLMASRRRHPSDDLATVISEAEVDGLPIPDEVAFALFLIVATAGHDTTSSSTAGAVWGFCEEPGEFGKIGRDGSLVPNLVEEAIRWSNPVSHFMRSAAKATTLRGREIAAGDWIMMSYLSASRDEAVFRDPELFRVERDASAQIAFGSGAHVCIGQHLARLEMRILFEELLPRLRSVEFAGVPVRSASTFVGGPKRLPVRCAWH